MESHRPVHGLFLAGQDWPCRVVSISSGQVGICPGRKLISMAGAAPSRYGRSLRNPLLCSCRYRPRRPQQQRVAVRTGN